MAQLHSRKNVQKPLGFSVKANATENSAIRLNKTHARHENQVIELYRNTSLVSPLSLKPEASENIRVLFAASELYPYVKTGGLGHVAASMPVALSKKGVDIRYFLPGYPEIKKALRLEKTMYQFVQLFGKTDARLLYGELPNGLKAYVLDVPSFFDRPHPYLNEDKNDWADNHLRFGAFCYVAAHIANYDLEWEPDIFHGNDWQCGLIPAYKTFNQASPSASTVMTIHNLGYQGLFPAGVMGELALPPESFSVYGVEYYNQVGFLKSGLFYSEYVTTVSPTYAHEIRTKSLGYGLEGLLQSRSNKLTGILNGIDEDVWDPQSSRHVRYHYGKRAIATRKKNKAVILKDMGLADGADKPLFAFVGRLTQQKGVDILVESMAQLLQTQDITLLLMGMGDEDLAIKCRALAEQYPDRVAVLVGYEEKLEHRFYAGADVIIVPSHFEPCGLVQMYAARYGALSIVRKTGGLADSVSDDTGFLFDQPTAESLTQSIMQALDLYHNEPQIWKHMQMTAMAQNFSWEIAAEKYRVIYSNLVNAASRQYLRRSLLS